jgi:hypothetical protein
VLHRTPPRSLRRLADFSVGILNKATRGGRRPVALEPVLRFGDEFDRMFESAAADHRVVCVRDSAYLDWRYHGAPGRRQLPFGIRMDGRLVGFLALESSGERAALADLFTAADPAIVDATIEAVIDKLAGDGCSLLGAALMEGSAAEGRLRRFGFLRRDQREFQVLARSDDPQLGTLTTRSAWHFCAADEDMDSVLRPDRDDERETPGPLTRPSATPR